VGVLDRHGTMRQVTGPPYGYAISDETARPDVTAIDVSVVEGAVRRGDAVVTSNMTHIRMVADAAGASLRIEST
jgi:hypothetical protein